MVQKSTHKTTMTIQIADRRITIQRSTGYSLIRLILEPVRALQEPQVVSASSMVIERVMTPIAIRTGDRAARTDAPNGVNNPPRRRSAFPGESVSERHTRSHPDSGHSHRYRSHSQ